MRNKNKKVYFVLILIVLFGVSVGYAAMNRVLNITGNSEIKQNTWNIYFDNVKVLDGSVTATSPPTIDSSKIAVNFSFMLDLPGDYYEFTVDVVNSGTIDAMIESIIKTPTLTATQAKYLNYIIEYQNGEQITSKQLVSKNSLVRLKVRVEYKKDLTESDLPTTTETLNLGFTLNYVQGDRTGVTVKNNGIKIQLIANGSLDDIGTIVTIGDQQFYTIGTEGDNVKLLSMYNLYVGNECISHLESSCTQYGEEATGMQDSTMLGYVSGQGIRKGTTKFSNTNSTYEGSIVEGYVNSYQEILEGDEYDVSVVEARLITYDELTDSDTFACVENDYCSDKYSWIYSTSYWSGSAININALWFVSSDGDFGGANYAINSQLGVRPVIVLKKSDIVVEIKPVANGSLDDIGTIVTIGDQQYYTIGTEGDNVKLLSMYNLHVGNQYDGENVVALASPTGKQSEIARGWFAGFSAENPIIGATAFSSSFQKGTNYSDYNGSIVEGYVNNYKTILENDYDVDIVEARLITYDELVDSNTFACVEYDYCSDKYSWIYSTTYWSGAAYDTDFVWSVNSDGRFLNEYCINDDFIGVRPVIIISKSLF